MEVKWRTSFFLSFEWSRNKAWMSLWLYQIGESGGYSGGNDGGDENNKDEEGEEVEENGIWW